MSERFRISLCHPRLIGMFYKDGWLKIFIYILTLFILYTGVCAATTYFNDSFNYNDAAKVNQLIYSGDESDISFDKANNKIIGTPIKYAGNDLIVNFLVSENYSNFNGIVIRFKEEMVEVIYRGYIVGDVLYSDINVESFKLKDVKAGDDKAVCEFQDMIDYILEDVNLAFSGINLFNAVINALANLFMVFIFCIASSFFTNPSLGLKIRIKLVLYCLGINFAFMILAVFFDAAWLQYAAIIFPFIYSHITFSHIIRVDKKRVGGEG